jgi:GT2 family glycosyltransferase
LTEVTTRHPCPALVTVVVPASRPDFLGGQLGALAAQDYDGAWETVVADNAARGRTREVVASFAGRLPGLRVVDAHGRAGASHARNVGAHEAHGDFLAFCDDDDEVAPGWIAAMADAATRADLVGGLVDYSQLNSDRAGFGPPQRPVLYPTLGFLPRVVGASCGIWHRVLVDVGGWNEDYRYCTDVELSWRVQLAGYVVGAAPDALVHARFRASTRAAIQQAFRWGVHSARLYRDFRHCGVPRPRLRTALRRWAGLAARGLYLLQGRPRRVRWLRLVAERSGRLAGAFRYRVIFF